MGAFISRRYLLVTAIGCVAGLLVSRPSTQLLIHVITVLMVLGYGVGIRILYRQGFHVTDVRLILLTFFFLYGIANPLVGFGSGPAFERYFSSHVRLLAHTAYFLGLLGLLGALYLTRHLNVRPVKVFATRSSVRSVKLAAMGGMIIGFGFFLAYYAQLGGISATLSLGRRDRSLALSEAGWNPWVQILLASIILYWLTVVNEPKRSGLVDHVLAVGVPTLLVVLWLAEGERGRIGYLVIGGLAVIGTQRSVRLSRKVVLALALLWVAFGVLQVVRQAFPSVIATGDWSYASRQIDRGAQRGWVSLLVPSEFRAPYITVLDAAGGPTPPRLGQTYARTPGYLVPGFVYSAIGGSRPENGSKEFGEVLRNRYSLDRAVSWGYSPVAESFVNFGWFGPPLVMFAYGLGASLLLRERNRGGIWRTAAYCVVAPLAWRLSRTGFPNAVTEIVYQFGVLGILLLCARVLDAKTRVSGPAGWEAGDDGVRPFAKKSVAEVVPAGVEV